MAGDLRKLSESGLALIKRLEGCRLEVYLDEAGVKTAGYGTTGHGVGELEVGTKISQEEADLWLEQDVREVEEVVNTSVNTPLLQNEFDALVSFVYNIGARAFKSSTLLKLLNTGDKEDAAREFTRWIHAGGKVSAGLVKRRRAERDLFLTPLTVEEKTSDAVSERCREQIRSIEEGLEQVLDEVKKFKALIEEYGNRV